jgi:type II secretory pathway predicted ATPase ExeA
VQISPPPADTSSNRGKRSAAVSKGQVVSQQLPKTPLGGDWAAIRSNPGSFELTGHALLSSPSPSLTYEPHFGLKEKPFSLSADPRFLYRSPTHTPAFDELLAGIRRREGLIVLTGEIGTGKTTLIRSVLQHLDRRTFTALVPDPFVSREDLLKMLLVDFGVVSLTDLKRGSLSGASRPDLSYPLYEFLDSLVPLQAFAVLIIDEAQNLPLGLLEEIRILSDLEQREKLLQVVLVGQPELKLHLKMPQMRQVDQRVSVRCNLTPLASNDVGKYVRHRLSVASEHGNHVQFSEGAIDAVFTASRGTPRVINLICDRALQRGHRVKATVIESPLILEAVASLGIEVSATKTTIARIETRAEKTSTGAPAAEVIKKAAVAIASGPTPLQILSEFAAEADVAAPRNDGRYRGITVAFVIAALLLAVSVAAYFVYFATRAVEVDALTLPARPKWTTAVQPAVSPSLESITRGLGSSTSSPASVRKANNGSYAIQVASFESRERADRLVSELAREGFRARTVEFNLGPPRGIVLQIRVDGYPSARDAARDLVRIRELPGYADAHLLQN